METYTLKERMQAVFCKLPVRFTTHDVVLALGGGNIDSADITNILYVLKAKGLINILGKTIRQKKRIVNLYTFASETVDLTEQIKIETLLRDITTYFLSDVADIVCC